MEIGFECLHYIVKCIGCWKLINLNPFNPLNPNITIVNYM